MTYTGKDIAYQLWKLGKLDRDFRYRRHRTYDGRARALDHHQRRGRGGRPGFGHADPVYNVIDVGQSYPQRVVKAGVAALGHAAGPSAPTTSPTRRSCSPPPPRARWATRSRRTRRRSRSRAARAWG